MRLPMQREVCIDMYQSTTASIKQMSPCTSCRVSFLLFSAVYATNRYCIENPKAVNRHHKSSHGLEIFSYSRRLEIILEGCLTIPKHFPHTEWRYISIYFRGRTDTVDHSHIKLWCWTCECVKCQVFPAIYMEKQEMKYRVFSSALFPNILVWKKMIPLLLLCCIPPSGTFTSLEAKFHACACQSQHEIATSTHLWSPTHISRYSDAQGEMHFHP